MKTKKEAEEMSGVTINHFAEGKNEERLESKYYLTNPLDLGLVGAPDERDKQCQEKFDQFSLR